MTEHDKTQKPPSEDLPADSHGDFFYDELMTGQPDATGAYFRERLRLIEAERRARAKKD